MAGVIKSAIMSNNELDETPMLGLGGHRTCVSGATVQGGSQLHNTVNNPINSHNVDQSNWKSNLISGAVLVVVVIILAVVLPIEVRSGANPSTVSTSPLVSPFYE